MVRPDLLNIPGRHRLERGGSFAWQWPGVYADFSLIGPGFDLDVEGAGCLFRVTIDGEVHNFGPLPAGEQHFVLRCASHTLDQSHFVRIQTTSESCELMFKLLNIKLHGKTSIIDPNPPQKSRHIEFVGDSWTCGFGNLSKDALQSDCSQSFAALAAEGLEADYSLVAASGHGLVKNFGEQVPSKITLFSKYPRAYPQIPFCVDWLGSKANIGVVLAGENDFSFEPYPDGEVFISTYRKLLDLMRKRHEGIRLFVLAVQRPNPTADWVKKAVAQELESGANDISLVELPDLDSATELGYLYHPSIEHHRQLAKILVDHISQSIAVTPRG